MFSLNANALVTGCGADLTGPSGTFLSPNYPTTYNRNAECYWTITVAEGNKKIDVLKENY